MRCFWLICISSALAWADGAPTYQRFCAPCHGARGDGRGPLARDLAIAPRDFTRGVYKFRSTESGSLPTRADLRRTIDEGLPGTPMPGWRAILPAADREALVDVLVGLSPRSSAEGPGAVVPLPPEPPRDPVAVARGRAGYDRMRCAACHGERLHGDGPAAASLTDDRGRPSRPADLTRARGLRRGGTAADIARTFLTGLDGTPMPSFRGSITDADAWDLARYVRASVRPTPWWERLLLVPVESWHPDD